jgi:uncharacterized protein
MRRLPLLLVALAALAVPASAGAQQAADQHTLGVQGLGEVERAPDVGSFSAEVRRTAPTSAGARAATNGRLVSIVGRMRALGVQRTDITTTSVRLTRERFRTPRTRALRVRYVAVGALAVRVGDGQVGRALDAAAGAGATGIDGPQFTFSQAASTQGRRDAEQAALADARARADAAAASQGQRVTGVQSIELDPGSGAQPVLAESAAGVPGPARKPAAPTPVLPGRQTFSSTVRVVYLLQPA